MQFDLEDKISSLVEEEIEKRVGAIQKELQVKTELLESKNKTIDQLTKANESFNSKLKQIEVFEVFKGLVDKTNFESVLNIFKLKKNKFPINGMDYEQIPLWFKVIFRYYEDREKVFALMDMFNIEYPTWAKEYKMPYEYNKEELKLFINPKYYRYITNGEIFDNNIGFFWRNVKSNKGNTQNILTSRDSWSTGIPWQLVLSNPLWVEDDLFELIIQYIKEKKNTCHCYYFMIQKYTEISKGQASRMAELLPINDLSEYHKKFIEMNPGIITENNKLVEMFKSKINDNKYSPFCYLNFPVAEQKDYIRSSNNSHFTKIDLVKKMNIPKEEKVELLTELAKQELEKS